MLPLESSKQHANLHNHKHSEKSSRRNPHSNLTPEDRFSRLCIFLEAQFGPNVIPLRHPRLHKGPEGLVEDDGANSATASSGSSLTTIEGEKFTQEELAELHRLHGLGIPVPGVEIKVDNSVVRVWLEDLDVEVEAPKNISKSLHDRVKAVVERAVECVSGIAG
jgi:cleavage and polyadenylation specificity factor subunit 3